MTALAVTREGRGTLYRFENKREAACHPLVQWGDAIWDHPRDTFDEYSLNGDLGLLLGRCDERWDLHRRFNDRVQTLRDVGKTDRQIVDTLCSEGLADDLWRALVDVARVPPDDPETVLRLIREDREHILSKERSMAKAEKAAGAAEPKQPKEPKAPKEKKERTVAGHALTTKITFGVAPATKNDKGEEVPGKPYDGEKNNPKRGKSAERFKLYRKNMTIAQALEAGMASGNVAHDLEKGYIVVVAKA